MASQPDFPQPDTIDPQAPPEVEPCFEPIEQPFDEPPEFGPIPPDIVIPDPASTMPG